MADTPTFQQFEQRFEAFGMDVASPPDKADQKRYPILSNVRQVRPGVFRSRPALNALVSAPALKTPWHSVQRLNDKPSGNFCYVCGIGTELFTTPPAASGSTPSTPVSRDAGYSGNPLCTLSFRPENDIADWIAVADGNRMRKVRLDGTVHSLGVAPPLVPPNAILDMSNTFQFLDIDDGSHTAGGGTDWTAAPGGTTTITRTNAFATVVTDLWGQGPDPGGGFIAGWRSIEVQATGLIGLGPGTILTDVNAFRFQVEEVHPASPAATTIKTVISTGTGAYVIVPTTAYTQFAPHAIVKIGVSSFRAVIEAVIVGSDGSYALRVVTPFTPAVGDSLSVQPTLFVSSVGNHFPSSALSATATKFASLPSASTTLLTRGTVTPLHLNLTAFPSTGKPVDMKRDELHVSLQASDWTRIDQIKIEADVQDGSFAKNYFSRTIRQADLLLLQNNNISAIDARLLETQRQAADAADKAAHGGTPDRGNHSTRNRQETPVGLDPFGSPFPSDSPGSVPNPDDPGAPASQGATGKSQWSEIRFKLSDWERFGEDLSFDLQDVWALRVVVTTNATAGTSDVLFGSWWIGGGAQPDVSGGAPYEYRYRYRVSSTGARSNWSPPGRALVWPHRTNIYVTSAASGQTEVDSIDYQRRGGTVSDWVTIGSTQNSSPQFTDAVDDIYALGAAEEPLALEGNVNAQPFPIAQASIRYTGSTGADILSGTLIATSGTPFPLNLLPGTGVLVNGIGTLVYRVLSTSLLEVYDNVGSATSANVKIEIPEPILMGQPLPIIFGPVAGVLPSENWYFACGDPKNPQRLYAFNDSTLDSTQGSYWIDVTSPGEPLQNGCSYMGRGYLWSTERMFAISLGASDGSMPARVDHIATGSGLVSRYALCVGDVMHWRSRDGIYSSSGGTAQNITAGTLATLFPSKGLNGATTNGIQAPLWNATNSLTERLSYSYDRTVWFDYTGIDGLRHSLAFVQEAGPGTMMLSGPTPFFGWWYDTYANAGLFHYSDEGENVRQILVGGTAATSKLFTMGASANGDDGTPFTSEVRTFAVDAGNASSTKLFGQGTLDADPSTATLTATLLADNFASVAATQAVAGAGRKRTILNINTGAGVYARNLAIDITWSIAAAETPELYLWGCSIMGRPDDTQQRADDYTDCGHWGPKELRGADIECDTQGLTKTIVFDYTKDDGSVGTVSASVNAPQKTIVPVAFASTVIGYEIRIHPSDLNTWKEYGVVKWHFDPLSDLTPLITGWESGDHLEYIQGLEIFADTNGANVNLTIQRDFAVTAAVLTGVNHPGRGWKSYSFAAPFTAYLRRIVPSGPIRIMDHRWIAQPEAPLGDVWEAQEIELGTPFGFAQSIEVEYASVSTLTLRYTVDGVLVYTNASILVSTGSVDPGGFLKRRIVLPAVKGRLAKFRMDSTAQFRLREKGCLIYTSVWGGQQFTWVPVLGASHHLQGAGV